jgi:hypothetical protein
MCIHVGLSTLGISAAHRKAIEPPGDRVDWVVCPQCGQPAEVGTRHKLPSTAGLVEHAHVQCVLRHWFLMPADWLVPWPDHVALRSNLGG